MISIALMIMVFALPLLAVAVCDEGASWLGYRLYSGRGSAVVCQEVPFTLDQSKGTVEKLGPDGVFQVLANTQDRNVGHLPFFFRLFEKGKNQVVLQWEADGAIWRGHYRYLKKPGSWWRFAVEVVCCLVLFVAGVLLLRSAI